jgi:hypothetical protein
VGRFFRILIRLAFWQVALGAPLIGLRYALSAAGLARVDPATDEIRVASLGEGYVLKSQAPAFRGGSVAWLMGGFVLDLRNARIAPGGADLRIVTIMGGSVVIVPPEMEVAVRLRGFGGGSNVPPSEATEAATLRIDSLTVMGGFNLSRKPLAEAGVEASGPLGQQA